MHLAQQIRQYYIERFNDLSIEKQFHFAGRLSLWVNDTECQNLLNSRKATFVGKPNTYDSRLYDLISKQPDPTITAYEVRAPYFELYKPLYGASLALFYVRHLLYFYHEDIRPQLLQKIPIESLHDISERLTDNIQALKILSTYAINYLYLTEDILFDQKVSVPLQVILEQDTYYDVSDPEQLRLLIYLYTHCIIADSNFYARSIAQEHLPFYHEMLRKLERLLETWFESASLDTKLEFLVAAKLCKFIPSEKLITLVQSECTNSLSNDGVFLVDTYNYFKGNKTTFSESEHRNVLFIMAFGG